MRTHEQVTAINKELGTFLNEWIKRHKLDPAEAMGSLEGILRGLLMQELIDDHLSFAQHIVNNIARDTQARIDFEHNKVQGHG